MASRRSCPLQPRREPPRRRSAIRVSGDLHDATLEARQGAASAARPRVGRIRGRRQQAAAALVAPPGPARCRRVSMAESDGRGGRDLSSIAVDARRGVSTADRCPPLGGRRRHRARTERVAGQSTITSASHGHRREQAAVWSRHGRAARLQDGSQSRRRAADQHRG